MKLVVVGCFVMLAATPAEAVQCTHVDAQRCAVLNDALTDDLVTMVDGMIGDILEEEKAGPAEPAANADAPNSAQDEKVGQAPEPQEQEASAPSEPDRAAPASPDIGAWAHRVDIDPMTDFENSSWVLLSSNSIAVRFGHRDRAGLVVRCNRNTTELIVDWSQYVDTGGIYNDHSVTYRIGTERSQTSSWGMSTDYEATFAPQAIRLLRQMKGSTSFLVETTPYGESSVTARFDITGIDAVIADVSQRCSWHP